ncbi:ferredoxin [Streptomyces sp. NPDC046915]|uniref:ferredoxin n=1 Tax=Streptomyces sp. NPDC046915 TaxID=3155257 RepID=UPI0033F6F32E
MDPRTDTVVDIDRTACRGHGLCAELLPEHITLDEWGYPLVDDTPIPARTATRARRAATDCPALALKLSSRQTEAQARQAGHT